ncbi:MAG: hypothetical protein AAF483_23670 [Planctomycetota bacterium]
MLFTLVVAIQLASRFVWKTFESEVTCLIAPAVIVISFCVFMAKTKTGVFGAFAISAASGFLSYMAFRVEAAFFGVNEATNAQPPALDAHFVMAICLALTFGLSGVFLVSIIRNDYIPASAEED